MKKVIPVLLLLLSGHLSWAHAIWIETAPSGIQDKVHEIKVFFGEYAHGDLTAADQWFSDLKDFKIIAIAPDGTIETLSASIASDHYTSRFTPRQQGVYTISLQHPVKDLYHGTKIHYFSSATVKVGPSDTGNEGRVNPNQLSLLTQDAARLLKNKEATVQVRFKGQPALNREVQVIAPNGWAKTLWTDTTGTLRFTPLWEGKYQVAFSDTEPVPNKTPETGLKEIFIEATYMLYVK